GLEVAVNGQRGEKTDAAGVAVLNVAAGQRLLTLGRDGVKLAEIELQLRPGESGEVIVALSGIGREVRHTFRAFPANEGSGSVSGVVRDPSGQPVDGATVTVEGRDESVMSGAEGQFELVLPRGIYSLNVSHPALADRRFTKVRALATMNVDLELGLTQARPGPGAEMEEVTVVARMTSDTAFASERNADSVLDVLGEREISIAGDSTAAQALQRVTGVTVKDDIVFVRGLGDRYSATFFNGAELPSPDPARRAISLDIFPTFLISGITVHKTYSSDLPGDFSGGAVRLETRSIPDTLTVSLKASGGGNTLSTTADVFSHPGGDEDFLGFDDGDRDIPSPGGVLTDNGRRPLSELSDDENQEIAQAIARNFPFNLREFELPPDFSAEFGIGNRFAFNDAEVGVSLSGLYDTEWRYREEQRAEIIANATGGVFEGEGSDLERTENDVKLGGVLNVVTEIGPDHSFSLTSLLSRVSTKGTFFEQGFNRSDDQDFRRVILEFTESQLFSNQFSGSHVFPRLGYTQVDWQVVASNAKRDEPGTREYVFSRTAGTDVPFKLATAPAEAGLPPVLSWEFLDEDTVDASIDIVVPDWIFDSVVGDWKFGARFTERDREFETVRWRYFVSAAASVDPIFQQSLGFPSVEMILSPERIGPNGFVLRNASSALAGGSNADNYGGTHDIHAGYFMADFDIGPLRIQGGVRVESSELAVTTDAIAGGATQVGQLDETDVLPSINLSWSLTDASQLRFGASRTVNRPQFRELSPTPYRDPETRFEAVGNPLLQQAEITNVDLRYEHYFSQLDGVSIAAFYKDLTKPIEVVTI
ncbi:MAG: TonB-dependent receptor, partial [Pseudomonadales bacterium]